MVFYEQPLSERIRAFLRLEHLAAELTASCALTDPIPHRLALRQTIEIIAILQRVNVRQNLLQTLDRQHQLLVDLSDHQDVDSSKLRQWKARLESVISEMRGSAPRFQDRLPHPELLDVVRTRSGGGVADLEVPALRCWLQRHAASRQEDLRDWLAALRTPLAAIDLALELLRGSASSETVTVESAFFQESLRSSPPQLVRVGLDPSLDVYPEISAAPRRLAIHLNHLDGEPCNRPVQLQIALCSDQAMISRS